MLAVDIGCGVAEGCVYVYLLCISECVLVARVLVCPDCLCYRRCLLYHWRTRRPSPIS